MLLNGRARNADQNLIPGSFDSPTTGPWIIFMEELRTRGSILRHLRVDKSEKDDLQSRMFSSRCSRNSILCVCVFFNFFLRLSPRNKAAIFPFAFKSGKMWKFMRMGWQGNEADIKFSSMSLYSRPFTRHCLKKTLAVLLYYYIF